MKEVFKCAYSKLVPLHKLVPNPRNSNYHPDRQVELLSKIIDYQGQRNPIVVSNLSGFIVKGHARLLALQKLGWKKAAVDFQDYDNEAQEYADLEADNRIAELAEKQNDKLLENLSDLHMKAFDFELLGLDKFAFVDLEPDLKDLGSIDGIDEDEDLSPVKEKTLEDIQNKYACPNCGFTE
jgi:hypothetical protein